MKKPILNDSSNSLKSSGPKVRTTAFLAGLMVLLGGLPAKGAAFFDDFSGPTLNAVWQASLPTMMQENRDFGPNPATYQGAPGFSFQTLDGSSVLRVTDTKSALQRRGWSTSTAFTASSFHYEVRFNSLVQDPSHSIDSFIEIGLLDPANPAHYDLVAPFGGMGGLDRQFVTASGTDNAFAELDYAWQDNTWYKLVLDAAPGQNIRASLESDTGTELVGQTLNHGASAYGSGFKLIISQAMGEPPQAYPQDVAIDYALLNVPEPSSAVLGLMGLGWWIVTRRRGNAKRDR